MIEVDYGGGGTAHGLEQSTCVSLGAPRRPYIKEQGGGRPALMRPKERRNPPPSRSRIHPFLVLLGGGRGKEREPWVQKPMPFPPKSNKKKDGE